MILYLSLFSRLTLLLITEIIFGNLFRILVAIKITIHLRIDLTVDILVVFLTLCGIRMVKIQEKSCLDEAVQKTTASVIETSGSVEEPPSPEGRLQPEDLSVTAKIKDIRDTAENLPPLKTPELKLSVRKLLGCTPSPPPISRDRSLSPENCIELKSQSSSDGKTLVSSNDQAKLSSQITRSSGQEDSVKGEHNSETVVSLCLFLCVVKIIQLYFFLNIRIFMNSFNNNLKLKQLFTGVHDQSPATQLNIVRD